MADPAPKKPRRRARPRVAAAAPEPRKLTHAEAAKELGDVALKTLTRWRKAGAPVPAAGVAWTQQDLELVAAWRRGRGDRRTVDGELGDQHPAAGGPTNPVASGGSALAAMRAERFRYMQARRRRVELENEQLAANTVPRDLVVQMLRERAHAFARSLRSRNARLAGLLEGKRADEIAAILNADAEEILELYRTAPTFLAAADVDDPLGAAPGPSVSADVCTDAAATATVAGAEPAELGPQPGSTSPAAEGPDTQES